MLDDNTLAEIGAIHDNSESGAFDHRLFLESDGIHECRFRPHGNIHLHISVWAGKGDVARAEGGNRQGQ